MFMVWYLHFLDALIEKKRTQHGLKHQLDIFRSHYRKLHAHKIVWSRNGKHDNKPHKKYPTVNNSGPSFEPSK
jgi:hypothetical protein